MVRNPVEIVKVQIINVQDCRYFYRTYACLFVCLCLFVYVCVIMVLRGKSVQSYWLIRNNTFLLFRNYVNLCAHVEKRQFLGLISVKNLKNKKKTFYSSLFLWKYKFSQSPWFFGDCKVLFSYIYGKSNKYVEASVTLWPTTWESFLCRHYVIVVCSANCIIHFVGLIFWTMTSVGKK